MFGFQLNDNYKKIIHNDGFKKTLRNVVIIFLIVSVICAIIGYYQYTNTVVVENYLRGSPSYSVMQYVPHSLVTTTYIFINNSIACGVFLLISVLSYKTNYKKIKPWWLLQFIFMFQGAILGIVLGRIAARNGVIYVLSGIIPHGTFEIPAMLLSFALGITYAHKNYISFNYSHNDIINFYLKRILPLVFIAAIMETWISPIVLGYLVNGFI